MITEIRNYIKGRIAAVDTDLKQLDDPFGTIDLAENDIDCGYKILFRDLAPSKIDGSLEDRLPVEIELYKKTYRDLVEDFDFIYDRAIEIRNYIADPKCIEATEGFYEALPTAISAVDLDSNQRVVRVTIGFIFINSLRYC